MGHFGGVKGITSEEAVSETVFAGNAMNRRAQYMYGGLLPRSPFGQVDAGLGKGTSKGTVTLIPPTHTIVSAIPVLMCR